MKIKTGKDIPYIIALLCMSTLLCLKLLTTEGYHSVIIEDTYAFTSWNWQFSELLRKGVIYPRWMSLDFWGYGSPVFILYSPLSYYATALFAPLLSSILKSMNFLKFLSLFLSGLGVYYVIRRRHTRGVAFLTGLLFISSPFYIFFIYYYGTYAAILSIPIIPPLLMYIFNYYSSRQQRNIVIAGCIYGILIMTHLITAYMIALVLFAMILMIHKPLTNSISTYLPFIGMALLVSSPYIFPLAFEIDHLAISNFIDKSSGFDFKDFFVFPAQPSLTSPFWNKYNFFFKTNFLVYAMVLGGSISVIIKFRNQLNEIGPKIEHAIIIALILTLFVQTSLSEFMWEILPFFKYIQFPFRWMIVSTILLALLTPFILQILAKTFKKNTYFKLFICISFMSILVMDYRMIRYSHYFPASSIFPPKSVNWTMEHLPDGVDIDYLTKKENHNEFLTVLNGDYSFETDIWQPQNKTFRIYATMPSLARIHHFYFPGWKAYLDGNEVEIMHESKTNAMIVRLPKGEYDLELSFEDTSVRKLSKFIFCLSLFFLSFYLIRYRRD